MPTLISVHDGQSVEYQNEDLVIEGSVGSNAVVRVTDGNVHIKGSVGAGAKVVVRRFQEGGFSQIHVGQVFINGVIVGGTPQSNTIIDGSIDSGASVDAINGVSIGGDVNNAVVESIHGRVTCGNVNSANVSSIHGSVRCGNVINANVSSIHGSVTAQHIQGRSLVNSIHGNVVVSSAENQSRISSVHGSYTINSQVYRNPQPNYAVVTIGSSRSGRAHYQPQSSFLERHWGKLTVGLIGLGLIIAGFVTLGAAWALAGIIAGSVLCLGASCCGLWCSNSAVCCETMTYSNDIDVSGSQYTNMQGVSSVARTHVSLNSVASLSQPRVVVVVPPVTTPTVQRQLDVGLAPEEVHLRNQPAPSV